MPLTFSISVGTQIESTRKYNVYDVILDLPNNTQKLISPKDVRDAFLSAWSNASFKQTKGKGGKEYIGIDSNNPEDRDIKKKIYIGKRNYLGSDVMTNYFLSDDNDTDIYINNMKPDSHLTQSTRITILCGTDSELYKDSTYIEAKPEGEDISLIFFNKGPINVKSENDRVYINYIGFPTVAETASASESGELDGSILKFHGTNITDGYLEWGRPEFNEITIGSEESIINIYGSPSVYVNNYPLEFIEDTPVGATVGGINKGDTFASMSFMNENKEYQNWPIVEVIRKLLYPPSPPELFIELLNLDTGYEYFPTGVTSSSYITYSVMNYTNNTVTYSIISSTGSIVEDETLLSIVGITVSIDLFNNDTGTFPIGLSANNGEYWNISTASIWFVNPIIYGFSSNDISFTHSDIGTYVGTLINDVGIDNRLLWPYLGPDQELLLPITGEGYMYILMPSEYPTFSIIKDPNGFTIHDYNLPESSSFTYSSTPITPVGANDISPEASWVVYKTLLYCEYSGSEEFKITY